MPNMIPFNNFFLEILLMDRFKVMLEDNVYLSRQQERGLM